MLDISREVTNPQIKSLREENDDLDLKDLKIMKNFLCKKFPLLINYFEFLENIDSDRASIIYKGIIA